MLFIGDQAWFYISARDALLTGHLPILGITSSVTWLHQGPLWAYLLTPALALSHFHPVSGAVLTAFFDSLTILMCYWLARLWFDSKTGLSAALLYAASPLAVTYSRMPYHTTLIPLFLCLLLIFQTRRRYFLAFLLLGLLYQLELATVSLWPIFLFFLIKSRYQPRVRDLLAFILGIAPFIVAGPVQTTGVFIWTLYHLVVRSGGPGLAPVFHFYLPILQKLLIPGLSFIVLPLLGLSVLYALFRRRLEVIWLLVPLALIFINGTPSEAYFALLVIPIIIFAGFFIANIFPKFSLIFFFTGWWLINSHFLISRNYLIDPGSYGASLSSRQQLSQQIFSASLTSSPQIIATGPGSEFASTIDPYRYLVWWQGLSQKATGSHLRFMVNDSQQFFTVLE